MRYKFEKQNIKYKIGLVSRARFVSGILIRRAFYLGPHGETLDVRGRRPRSDSGRRGPVRPDLQAGRSQTFRARFPDGRRRIRRQMDENPRVPVVLRGVRPRQTGRLATVLGQVRFAVRRPEGPVD